MKDPPKEIDICPSHRLLCEEIVRHECHSVRNVFGDHGRTLGDHLVAILDDETKRRKPSRQFDADRSVRAAHVNDGPVLHRLPVKTVEHMSGPEARSGLKVMHGILESSSAFGIFAKLLVGAMLHIVCEIECLSHEWACSSPWYVPWQGLRFDLAPVSLATSSSHPLARLRVSQGENCPYVPLWADYPRERTPHFLEPHANPLIQKRPLRQRFCGRRMGDDPCLRLFEEMIRHGHTKDSPNLRFASPAFLGYLGKRSGFTDGKTQGESKPMDCLQGWRP